MANSYLEIIKDQINIWLPVSFQGDMVYLIVVLLLMQIRVNWGLVWNQGILLFGKAIIFPFRYSMCHFFDIWHKDDENNSHIVFASGEKVRSIGASCKYCGKNMDYDF